MNEYIEQLKNDFICNNLLMECIEPNTYDWLVSKGFIPANHLESFSLDAGIYRQAWLKKHPKRLQDILDDPVVDQGKRSEEEKLIRKNIAKKMCVYDYLNKKLGVSKRLILSNT